MTRRYTPYVYFVRRADGEGPVKIGCSQAPKARLCSLMAWSPYVLEVVATVPGDETLERRFHGLFRHLWERREWFRPAPELTLALAELATGTFDMARLPDTPWRPLSKLRGRKWTRGQRLRHRLASMERRSGIRPRNLDNRLYRFDVLTEPEQAALEAELETFFSDPLRHGSVLPYPWAAAAYTSYAAKHGLPAIEAA